MTADSVKQRSVELLWVVGSAALSLTVVSVALALSAKALNLDSNDLVENFIAVIAGVGGGAFGLRTLQKRKGGP